MPEMREFDFDPVADVLADRGRHVMAVLTIIRAYELAGRPAVAGKPLGGFDLWSSRVRRRSSG
jgi:putative DNA primase/helicase